MAVLDGLVNPYSTSAAVAVAALVVHTIIYRYNLVPWARNRKETAPNDHWLATSPENEKSACSTESTQSYVDVFPPSSRDGIRRNLPDVPLAVDPIVLRQHQISMEDDWHQCDDSIMLPSEISLGEVRLLGDFPNYATLSDVPLPEVCEGFILEKARHRPYRPFRWAYHQTMALQRLETDWWLELEQTYKGTLEHRLELYAQYPDSILRCLPGADLAAKEVMEMALQFYCARYPQYFSLSNGERGWVFHNAILKQDTVIAQHHPLHILLHHIPEDFVLMLRNRQDGRYYFRGGVICSSLGWNLGTKIGKQLGSIHEEVPHYEAKMAFSMDRFFAKLPTNRPIQRGAWGIEIDRPLFSPPGAGYDGVRETQDPQLSLDRLHLRVDWQTLRRLPLSGAIAFNYRAIFTPLHAFRTEPYVPSLVYRVLTQGDEAIRTYKNTWHTQHVVLPALEQWIAEQEDTGLIERNWEPETLKENPFYPGWEEKWREQQEF